MTGKPTILHLVNEDMLFYQELTDRTADEELRLAVRATIWDPIEPFFVWIARHITNQITRWFL